MSETKAHNQRGRGFHLSSRSLTEAPAFKQKPAGPPPRTPDPGSDPCSLGSTGHPPPWPRGQNGSRLWLVSRSRVQPSSGGSPTGGTTLIVGTWLLLGATEPSEGCASPAHLPHLLPAPPRPDAAPGPVGEGVGLSAPALQAQAPSSR